MHAPPQGQCWLPSSDCTDLHSSHQEGGTPQCPAHLRTGNVLGLFIACQSGPWEFTPCCFLCISLKIHETEDLFMWFFFFLVICLSLLWNSYEWILPTFLMCSFIHSSVGILYIFCIPLFWTLLMWKIPSSSSRIAFSLLIRCILKKRHTYFKVVKFGNHFFLRNPFLPQCHKRSLLLSLLLKVLCFYLSLLSPYAIQTKFYMVWGRVQLYFILFIF